MLLIILEREVVLFERAQDLLVVGFQSRLDLLPLAFDRRNLLVNLVEHVQALTRMEHCPLKFMNALGCLLILFHQLVQEVFVRMHFVD